ncbi:MAG: peptidoglycan-binding protein [Treponema sp.]|jgi:hypothetical protein|nr:peptidoglycan-binding protein [Treponema sp.]
MNCDKVLDILYYSEHISLLKRVLINFHVWHCAKCAVHQRVLQTAGEQMKEDFFPPARGIAEQVMTFIHAGETFDDIPEHESVSFRAWVVTGIALLVSLSSAYLGIDYLTPVNTRAVNFMLSLGITVGGIITAFGAIFIGCHIKELSEWFGLHSGQ